MDTMELNMEGEGEFEVETPPQCFICLADMSILIPDSVTDHLPACSIQHLSRYLMLDLNEAFNDRGGEDTSKGEKSSVNVKLCESCANLNETFSELYQQLEKIEIKVTSCLKRIHGNMLGAKGVSQLGRLDGIRTTTMEKCLLKLTAVKQRLSLWNSTEEDVEQNCLDDFLKLDDNSDVDFDVDNVKVELFEPHLGAVEESNNDLDIGPSPGEDEDENAENLTELVLPGPTTSSFIADYPECTTDPQTGRQVCTLCGRDFINKRNYRVHYRSAHLGLDARHECPKCHKILTSRSSFSRHKRQNSCVAKKDPLDTEDQDPVLPMAVTVKVKEAAGSRKRKSCGVNKDQEPLKPVHRTDVGTRFKWIKWSLTCTRKSHLNERRDNCQRKLEKMDLPKVCLDDANVRNSTEEDFDVDAGKVEPMGPTSEEANDPDWEENDDNLPEIPPPSQTTSSSAVTGEPQCTIDPKTGRRKCSLCPKSFSCLRDFIRHYECFHLKIRHICNFCGKEFSYRQTYEYHYLTAHSGIKFKCPKCNKFFKDPYGFKKHQQRNKCVGENFHSPVATASKAGQASRSQSDPLNNRHCKLCEMIFPSQKHYTDHHRTVHAGIKYKCTKCNAAFKLKSILNEHLRRDTCRKERQTTAQKGAGALKSTTVKAVRPPVALPMSTSEDVKPDFSEDIGDAIGPRSKNDDPPTDSDIPPPFKTPPIIVAENPPPFTVNPETGGRECGLCSKAFPGYSKFIIHYETFHLKIRYVCTVCDKRFLHKISYFSHYRADHMGVRFMCQRCNKLFKDKSGFKKHQRKCVAGNDPVQVNDQEPQSSSSTIEAATAETNKDSDGRHLCKLCGKTFSRRRYYTAHHRAEHVGIRFKCPKCNAAFKQKSALNDHWRRNTCWKRLEKTATESTETSQQCLLTSEAIVGTSHESTVNEVKPDCSKASKLQNSTDLDSDVDNDMVDSSEQSTSVGVNDDNEEDLISEQIDLAEIIPPIPTQSTTPPSTVPDSPQGAVNPKTGRHHCSLCSKTFISNAEFVKHYDCIHRKIRQLCTLCGKDFAYRHNYIYHYRTFHGGLRFRCRKCNKIFRARLGLKKHQRRNACGPGRDQADDEDQDSNIPEAVAAEKGDVTVTVTQSDPTNNPNRPQCNLCGKTFALQSHYIVHHRKAHANMRYKCNKCNATFKQKEGLNVHQQRDTCGTGTVREPAATLRIQHMQIIHEESAEVDVSKRVVDPESGRIKCMKYKCGKEFKNEDSYLAHYKAKHPQLKFKCGVCGKEFRHRENYDQHYNCDHLGVRYHCDKCNKSFKYKVYLTKHRVRCGLPSLPRVRDKICDLCGKGFATSNRLKEHVKAIHLKLKERACNHCGMKFAYQSCLKLHIKVVHLKIRDCVCEVCGKVFGKPFNLQFHKKKAHPELGG